MNPESRVPSPSPPDSRGPGAVGRGGWAQAADQVFSAHLPARVLVGFRENVEPADGLLSQGVDLAPGFLVHLGGGVHAHGDLLLKGVHLAARLAAGLAEEIEPADDLLVQGPDLTPCFFAVLAHFATGGRKLRLELLAKLRNLQRERVEPSAAGRLGGERPAFGAFPSWWLRVAVTRRNLQSDPRAMTGVGGLDGDSSDLRAVGEWG